MLRCCLVLVWRHCCQCCSRLAPLCRLPIRSQICWALVASRSHGTAVMCITGCRLAKRLLPQLLQTRGHFCIQQLPPSLWLICQQMTHLGADNASKQVRRGMGNGRPMGIKHHAP